MTMIGDIQALNAVGVDLIDRGDYEQAADAFNAAVSTLSGALLSPSPIGGGDAVVNHKTASQISIYAFEDECNEAEDGAFYAFPFFIECKDESDNDDDDTMDDKQPQELTSEEYSRCVIPSLFNLGLCFHLEWEHQKTNLGLLHKALSFYEQALSLTAHCTSAMFLPKDPLLKVLCAVCANATHVHSELANLDQVRLWNRTLKYILHSTDDQDLTGPTSYFAMNAFFNGFDRVAGQAA